MEEEIIIINNNNKEEERGRKIREDLISITNDRMNIKRKFQHDILELPEPKHACLEKASVPSSNIHHYMDLTSIKDNKSGNDSNSFSQDSDSVMSLSINDSGNNTSSVNWSGNSFETKTTFGDEISTSNFYACPSFEDRNSSGYETKQLVDDDDGEEMEDVFCSNGVAISNNNFVLSSGRWNVTQDTEQGTQKLTIDKEFEQYFSMLML